MKKSLPLLSVLGLATSVIAPVFAQEGAINVVSREDGSGTRSAFVEIVGVVDENEDDATVDSAVVQNGTNQVMQTVAGDANSIGYISLGSLDDSVKAVTVDGVEATADNIKAGEYAIARPFNVAWNKEEELSDVAKDFMTFIESADGQAIVEEEGFISTAGAGEETAAEGEETEAAEGEETEAAEGEETEAAEGEETEAAEGEETEAAEGEETEAAEGGELAAYEAQEGLEGTIEVVGSTSVTPVMEKLAEKYQELNSGVTINITSNGSSAGMTAAMDGTADLGMASRELKEEESAALESKAIAMDGIAVIVNPESSIEEVSLETIKGIYLGEIANWEDVK